MSNAISLPSNGEIRANWSILLACCVGMAAGTTGIPFYTIGLFVEPLNAEFGWSRASIQAWLSLFLLTTLISVPACAWLVERHGPRKIAVYSLLLTAMAFASVGIFVNSLTAFYATAILLGLVGAGTSPLTWTTVINGWFDQQRGLALGLTLAGTGTVAFLAPPYVVWLLQQSDWRLAYIGLAVLPALACPLVFSFLKDPQISPRQKIKLGNKTGLTLAQALRHRRFWTIAIAFFLVSAAISGSIANLVPLLHDKGLSATQAATVVSTIGLSVIAGRVVAGYFLDRIWAPAIGAVMLSAPAVSAVILLQPELSMGIVFVAAVLLGLAAGAEFDFIAYLSSRYFGLKQYAKIYGFQYAAFIAGAALSPPLFAWIHDTTTTYTPALVGAATLFLIGAAMLLTLGPYPALDKSADQNNP